MELLKKLTSHPKWWVLPAIIMLTLTYFNHFDNAFHFDDSHTIVNNTFIKEIGNIPLFFKDATTTSSLPTNQAYRPMITSLNAIDYWIAGGLDQRVFHIHIFMEYIILLFLLYFIFLRVFKLADDQDHPWAAFFAVVFFAFHTANAETINYVIARSDEFSTLMIMIGLLIFMRRNGWKRQLGLIPFFIGCLAKPTALMLAPILFIYEWVLVSPGIFISAEKPDIFGKTTKALTVTLPYFVVGAAMYFFTRSMFSDSWTPSNVKPIHYLITQPMVFVYYLKTFLLPNHLTADTDMAVIKNIMDVRVIFGLLVIAATVVFAFAMARKRKTLPIAFGIFWFYVALVPSSSIIPLAEVMNNHRTFFPYIGLVISLSWIVYLFYAWLASKTENKVSLNRGFVSAILLIVAIHAYGVHERNEVWNSDESLWYDVTIASPENGRGLMNYGLSQMAKGDYETAMDYFDRASKTRYGQHPYLFINYGVANNALKNFEEAEKYFKKAVAYGPGYPDCHFYYGKFLMERNRIPEAIERFKRTVELSPAHPGGNRLLRILSSTEETLVSDAEKVAEALPTAENYLNLSLQYYRSKRYEDCIAAARKAIELEPNYPEAYNNICSAYNSMKQWDEAIEACTKALDIQPDYVLAKSNLNWAKQKKKESGQ